MEIEEKKAEARQTPWDEEEEEEREGVGGGTLYLFAFIVSDLNLADGERAAYIKRVASLCEGYNWPLRTSGRRFLFSLASITQQQR